MLTRSAAKMYPAAERGYTETTGFRSYHTFNFGAYQQPHKKPLGSLMVLNDETLGANQSAQLDVDVDTLVLLLPVVGGIVVDGGHEEKFVHAGQAQWLHVKAGGRFTITNPFDTELVNYLQLRFAGESLQDRSMTVPFALNERPNSFADILPFAEEKNSCLQAYVGKFSGRQEAIHPLSATCDAAMVFVIQGAFEVENRLLEAKDGLALWNTESIELEALSNEAILLLLEVNRKDS